MHKSRPGTLQPEHSVRLFPCQGCRATAMLPDGAARRVSLPTLRRSHPVAPMAAAKLRSSPVMGQSVVVLGAQWGDEGKGKIVDLLTEEIG
ncbi:adenylosuccinate synthetase, partial [Xanthomonas oryzae pv. oryzicola]|uniref:adenylosuccinate synthetase n=1 Tax=Xanthomonas oryzae TaxID=347 RepID=UPI003CF95AC8